MYLFFSTYIMVLSVRCNFENGHLWNYMCLYNICIYFFDNDDLYLSLYFFYKGSCFFTNKRYMVRLVRVYELAFPCIHSYHCRTLSKRSVIDSCRIHGQYRTSDIHNAFKHSFYIKWLYLWNDGCNCNYGW